ncbi:hypothetical protein HOY80DRAFT_707850 [Tuber brumale]|nr:hypothetical protein HOY80DRAFT_707850 [Tuber brumale]
MLARLFVRRATRFVHPPSGSRVRHIWASSQRRSPPEAIENPAVDSGIRGTDELAGPNTILGRICKLESDIAGSNATTTSLTHLEDRNHNFQDRVDRYILWMTGTIIVGAGAAAFKIYSHAVSLEEHMIAHTRDAVGHLEKVMVSKFESVVSKFESVESRMGSVESRMGSVESRMGSMESSMGRMEQKMDRMETKLDELYSYLKTPKN